MKKYRLRISLEDDVAEILDKQKDRSEYVSAAVEWYARYGQRSMEKLDKIVEILSNGQFKVQPDTNPVDEKTQEILDDIFSAFEI